MKLTLQSSPAKVIDRELAAWGQIFKDNETSVGEKIFKGWRQLIGYGYNVYWRMGNECEHWIRIVMNQETKKLVESINPSKLDVLEVSGKQWQDFGFQSYRSLNYPELDICSQKLDETFDLVVAEQVFEHLLWPYRAGNNIYEMVKPGGYFLITVPFLIRVHHCPVDCTRWTELGLKHFLAECGFALDSIQTGAWGNRQCLRSHARHGICEYYVKYWHSLENEELYPASIWALARKN
jgi:SAM-dependent methyltransferase